MFGYKTSQIRKFLVTVAAFLTAVVAVVLEAAIGFYGDGQVETGEWLALGVLLLNCIGVFKIPNDDVDVTPTDEIGEEVDYDLEDNGPLDSHGDTEMGMEGEALRPFDGDGPDGPRGSRRL